MAMKFGPQWLRDLSDAGNSTSQPTTPTMGVKFKLAEYRYGREEMLALFNENSPPPDQVRKHQSIFSKEIQSPVTMVPLTQDEQRLVSDGFNSTVVLRAAGRGSGPPLRGGRGGSTADRGRGRGRGRGEGYVHRTAENGDLSFSRPTQDGWEQVGRKYGERSYVRGYDDVGPVKREFSRSLSDNWREKRNDDEEEDDNGNWRNHRENNALRWGPPKRERNWRERERDYVAYDGDRRPMLKGRAFDSDPRAPRRTSESYENDEVPEWVEDDVEDDPGTFDSCGMFLSTKGVMKEGEKQQAENTEKKKDVPVQNIKEPSHLKKAPKEPYVPPKARNGTGDAKDPDSSKDRPRSLPSKDEQEAADTPSNGNYVDKGDGDSGFAFPDKETSNGTSAPPGQFIQQVSQPQPTTVNPQQSASVQDHRTRHIENDSFLHMEKSLQNLVAEMTADPETKTEVNVADGALPLTHENSNKWFYRDPQGEVQGPFTSEEMSQWFSAGYFTMSLVVKRGCDDSFKQLGELIKRYGRVPFLPGPPLPPLITSNIPTEVSGTPSAPTLPSLISPMTMAAPTSVVGPPLTSLHDPMVLQQMLLQQEYLKQTFLMRQMQMQTMAQMQEQESFKSLSPEQQQHLSLQMMMQTHPLIMQQMQQLQQQQLHLQQQMQEQQQLSAIGQPPEGVLDALHHPVSQPSNSSVTVTTPSGNNNNSPHDSIVDDNSMWGGEPPQSSNPGVGWPQQPTSLWDIDPSKETLSPAYQAHLEKMKREREEERLKEEEKIRQEELMKKVEELNRQQQELELQREQMRREKEELERQKLQKMEEARQEEEAELRREIERQQREQQEAELRRQEEERRCREEEKKKEREMKKQEEKRKKEEEKRRQQEEQKRQQEEARRRKQEAERLREQELRQEMEEERMRKEAEEKERQEAQRRLQLEVHRQQENLRRQQQAQREQLANMQLPASSNWAAQQSQPGPAQSRSLTEIQEEEARKEMEKQREQQEQMQRMQEQSFYLNQQNQQKSWATHASHGVPPHGLSLLDIQMQEQENDRKSQKENKAATYQSKLSIASASSWTGVPQSSGGWAGQNVWEGGSSNSAGFWDQVATSAPKKSAVKESGEFPALKNPNQQAKRKEARANKKAASSKQKKEEETVQKLFQQNRQQDGFSKWVTERVSDFSAPIDVPTFVSFIIDVENPDDIRDYIKTYLGDTKESNDFAKQFVEIRSRFKNQARLEKQQEEDSIWGPAPAVNPHQVRGNNNSGQGGDWTEGGKSKNKKKKQKMQKLDGSILGFTVHADPNRKNAAGEFESIQ